MGKHFLQYWRPKVAEATWGNPQLLTHSASDQLNRVSQGDMVWIVTKNKQKHLILIGRIVVDHVSDYESAQKEWGQDVWKAKYHIFSDSDTATKKYKIDITKYAERLRFISEENTKLIVKNDQINPQQLQTLRTLEISSANLLNNILFNSDLDIAEEIQSNIKSGAGFGNPIENKKIERAAVNYVTKFYRNLGWKVESREREKIGYDLDCTKDGRIEKVEVKGVKGTELSFIITNNEVNLAERDNSFVLCIVTEALSKNRKLNRYSSNEFLDSFDLRPIAYKAVLKV